MFGDNESIDEKTVQDEAVHKKKLKFLEFKKKQTKERLKKKKVDQKNKADSATAVQT